MSRIVDPLAVARAWRQAGASGPPVDLYETAEMIVIRLAVPGAEGSTLTLTIGEDAVVLRGESPPPGSRWGDRTVVHWQEIPYGRFERRVPVPAPVDGTGARAQFRNGILEMTLPKRRPAGARSVPISFA
ncbi:MAG TPA: Hsp20/alpha crystallin family protein [Candidatus Tectomicrobia bacterium]|nr:Hsp20/alpha crystallin family protein [Candidatus Tectomicrobia bacterium]